MLEFRTPTLDDKERIDFFVSNSDQIGCDITFVNTYLWCERYDTRVAITENAYFKAYFSEGVPVGYAFPLTTGDIRTAIDMILEDARQRGVQPVIGLLNDRNTQIIRELYGDRVDIEEDRDAFDYLYLRSDLSNLSGKKYHAKRNHLSRFYRTYENCSVEEITEKNFDDVISVAERWQEGSPGDGEMTAIRNALQHFDRLRMFGLVLYVDGRPVAMSFGSRINNEVCDVNFEKAVEIDEAYAVINNEFAKKYSTFTYLNREEDMGLDGLRKAKLSYHPYQMIQKNIATFQMI